MRRRSLSAAFVVASLACAARADAGSFGPGGHFVFDPKAVGVGDFEQEDDGASVGESGSREERDDALAGAKVAVLPPFGDAGIRVEVPAGPRRYRASMWVRGGHASAAATVDEPLPDGAGGGAPDDPRSREVAALYPTGRITSDGWVELASDAVHADGAEGTVSVGVFCPGGCEIDAVELVPEEVLDAPLGKSCEGVGDAACSTGQVCFWSTCRNVSGWVPPIPEDRAVVTAYLENRLKFLFGPFINRGLDLPAALAAVERMRSATDRWSYWNAYMLAVRRLHDGHTTTSGIADFVIDNPRPITPCFLEGVADASHAIAPADPAYRDVLVSHVGGDHHLDLRPGDRLVRVDGKHPIAWARGLVEVHWGLRSASNPRTFAEIASSLRALISRFAHRIEVIRCDPDDGSCGEVETIVVGAIPFDAPGTPVSNVRCDNRPLRHLADSPANHGGNGSAIAGLLNESDTTERIYGIEWESLFTSNGSNGVGASLKAGIKLLTDESASAVILDHRRGTGGTFLGPAIVWDFAMPRQPLTFMQDRQGARDEQPTLAEGLALFNQAVTDNEVLYAGNNTPTTMPVALLLTEDVSASDWLPLGMKGQPNVRSFGPYETNGAFSTRYQLGYWLGLNVVLASGDTFADDGRTLNGTGVSPDVTVLPLQSDLIAGRDTVFEAALAWVRQELAK